MVDANDLDEATSITSKQLYYMLVMTTTDDAHRLHRAPEKMPNFPHAHVRPLAANAGTVLAWHHNTIHWGSSCSPYAEQPRKSIAMSFRLREAWRPWTDKDAAS